MVSFNQVGRMADEQGVEWHSEFVNKPTNEAQTIGKGLVLNHTNNNYELGVAGSVGDFAVVIKSAIATAPRVEVVKKKGLRVSMEVGTGETLTPHCHCKLDNDGNLAKYVDGVDLDPNLIIGQYYQHANPTAFADSEVALGNATAGHVVYIELGARPASVIDTTA